MFRIGIVIIISNKDTGITLFTGAYSLLDPFKSYLIGRCAAMKQMLDYLSVDV